MTTTQKIALILITAANLVLATAARLDADEHDASENAPVVRCSQGYHSWRRARRGVRMQ